MDEQTAEQAEQAWDSMGLRPADHTVAYLYKAAPLQVQARAWCIHLDALVTDGAREVVLGRDSVADLIRILETMADQVFE